MFSFVQSIYISRVQIIEAIDFTWEGCNIDDILWNRRKCWQPKLLTNANGVNRLSELYSVKTKGCRKR